MRPSKETLDEFMRLYEAEFNETLTADEATEMWVRVMDLYLVLYRKPVNSETLTQSGTADGC